MGGQDFQDFHHVFVVFFVLSTVHDVDVILGSAVSYSSSNHHHNRPPAEVKHMFRDLNGIRCPPCSRQHCAVKRPSKLHCKGGTALDVCGCCPVCAKIEDEHCGGKWNYLGTCDHGLFCQEVPLEPEFDTAAKHGVCRKGSSIDILILADEAPKETRKDVCQPKCTSDFCSKNPRAICSAFDNADQTKPCQEICQHTSCMACRFVNPDREPCPKCNKDDFPCIKKFGRCVRKQSCRRRKFPCTKSASTKHESGKFQCSVPDCPQ